MPAHLDRLLADRSIVPAVNQVEGSPADAVDALVLACESRLVKPPP